ncbi:MAG: 1-acyl-sn-glycerol-3-phosphate acyltransferase [Lachnospiraceae bacterium]|nr:1-acyl-sn-glycerol-3-phosphate acyltransferase [Lachnospiraceae bacterium]
MLRLYYVVIISSPFIIFYICKAAYIERHDERFSEAQRYKTARHMVILMKYFGRIHTSVYGVENLPSDGGYVMYSNHQGKYDALGIIAAHFKPCTVLIDDKRADLPLTKEFVRLLKGSRLDKTQPRSQVHTIHKIIAEVKQGRRYLIFPEGGYDNNKNNVREFLPGAFKCAIRAQSPIVPVVLIDSYKPFGVNSLRRVRTQVHFLAPLYYEDYKEMSSSQIAKLIRDRITAVIESAVSSTAAHA